MRGSMTPEESLIGGARDGENETLSCSRDRGADPLRAVRRRRRRARARLSGIQRRGARPPRYGRHAGTAHPRANPGHARADLEAVRRGPPVAVRRGWRGRDLRRGARSCAHALLGGRSAPRRQGETGPHPRPRPGRFRRRGEGCRGRGRERRDRAGLRGGRASPRYDLPRGPSPGGRGSGEAAPRDRRGRHRERARARRGGSRSVRKP
jgi:hypothetical protein